MHTSPYFTVFVNIPLNVIAFEIVILFRTLPYNTPCRGNDCPVSALAVSKLIQDNQFPLPNQFNKLIISHRLLNCPPIRLVSYGYTTAELLQSPTAKQDRVDLFITTWFMYLSGRAV